MSETIDRFDGEYRFLSNFYTCNVRYEGIDYRCAEAAFQAAKTFDPVERQRFSHMTAGQAKREGRKVQLRPDWEQVKDKIMLDVVAAKFSQHPSLAGKLLRTSNALLVEGNHWRDIYWGVCNGKGQNKLGLILMAVREKLAIDRSNGTFGGVNFNGESVDEILDRVKNNPPRAYMDVIAGNFIVNA